LDGLLDMLDSLVPPIDFRRYHLNPDWHHLTHTRQKTIASILTLCELSLKMPNSTAQLLSC